MRGISLGESSGGTPDGDVAAYIVVNQVLGAGWRHAIEAYLGNTYGIAMVQN